MKMQKNLLILASLLSIQTCFVIANEEQNTQNELPEYMQYIPEEILIACSQRPIRACENLLKNFFCACKESKGNLTEGEKQLCSLYNILAKHRRLGGDRLLSMHIAIILEENTSATPEQIAELIDRTIAAKKAMLHRAKNNK